MRFFVIFPFFIFLISAADEKEWKPSDKTGWIDPHDLENRKIRNVNDIGELLEENQRLRGRVKELEAAQISSTNPTCDRSFKGEIVFKHFLRKISSKFSTPGGYFADFRISQSVMTLWNDFLASDISDTKNLQDIGDSVADLFSRAKKDETIATESGIFDAIIDFFRSYIPLLNFCILLPAAALLLVRILRVSRWQLALWIFFLIFFVSVVWTWIHLWKERQAEAQARFVRHAHQHGAAQICKPDISKSYWKALKNYVQSWTWFKPDDPCVEYFKDTMIDPVWTVTPLEAVSVAVMKFFVLPLEPLGKGIGKFWTAFLKDLPVTLWVIVLPATGICVTVLLLICWGYRLRLLYGLVTLDPSPYRFQAVQNLQQNQSVEASATQTAPSVTSTPGDSGVAAEPAPEGLRNRQSGTHVRRNSASLYPSLEIQKKS